MRKFLLKKSFYLLVLLHCHESYAAKSITFYHANPEVLNQLLAPNTFSAASTKVQLKEISKTTDVNQTQHIRYQQTYDKIPIFGAESIKHIQSSKNLKASNSAFVNGMIYDDLAKDLEKKPEPDQLIKGLEKIKSTLHANIKQTNTQLIIYVDRDLKAHWAYQISFYIDENGISSAPSFIIDANRFNVYKSWDEVKNLTEVKGGGYGGNKKMGKLSYDGKHLSAMTLTRDDEKNICYLANEQVVIYDGNHNFQKANFSCPSKNFSHGGLYWNEGNDAVNGAYSPNNDALYAGETIKRMYDAWYHIPVLVTYDKKPMVLKMITHINSPIMVDNAKWDPFKNTMSFGDGKDTFYPLTSIGVAAHEVSHGFTQQHSHLIYFDESGAINESFSDMAAQAAEYFVSGKNSWQIGPEITKELNALRYMDRPSKDCDERESEEYQCSIDHVDNYYDGLQVHFSSGVFNRAFYLIATSENWDVKKAFDVMVQANRFYWPSSASFMQGACGVMFAARDLKYPTQTITKAFAEVGLNTEACEV